MNKLSICILVFLSCFLIQVIVSETFSDQIGQYSLLLSDQKIHYNKIQKPVSNNESNCWIRAGHYYNINPWILYSIAYKETGGTMKIERHKINTNGSIDIGLMQINSVWFQLLKKQYNLNQKQISQKCNSIDIAAWILNKKIKQYGHTWKAVGTYHSKTPKYRNDYAQNIYQIFWHFMKQSGNKAKLKKHPFHINNSLPNEFKPNKEYIHQYKKGSDILINTASIKKDKVNLYKQDKILYTLKNKQYNSLNNNSISHNHFTLNGYSFNKTKDNKQSYFNQLGFSYQQLK